ncbi:MAG: MoxR family ATPase [Planctomycetes bacterium]|nr:MoxR family ATPase [Planctomycetota bacterium]MBI3846411.1 MoxR family ATPase [Planctomycetota bacterium]
MAARLRAEIAKVVVGHEEAVNLLVAALLAPGHVLLEGVPGIGKTLLVRALAKALDLEFRRIQFTPDLMPSDITGTQILNEGPGAGISFRFQRGPVFGNVILADEINRATPKTQSALLEAMEERQVTIGGEIHPLDDPFLVLATQNPIELEGTYPLPEAQVDRFLFKILMAPPALDDLKRILARTTGEAHPETKPVVTRAELLRFRALRERVVVAEPVLDYAARLVQATQPPAEGETGGVDLVSRFVRFGASPRGGRALILAAQAFALEDGRVHASRDDIRRAALPALRHRLVLTFEGEAEGISSDAIVRGILEAVPLDGPRVERVIRERQK